MSKTYFYERQSFDQWALKFIMAGIASISIAPFAWVDWGPPVPLDSALALMGLVTVLIFVNAMIFAMNFETKITSEGFYYKYPPIVWKWKGISFDEIQDIKMRKYNAWREFGGRGFRGKPASKLKAIIIKGNDGTVITYSNGKKLLLGTQRPYEFKVALQKARGEASE